MAVVKKKVTTTTEKKTAPATKVAAKNTTKAVEKKATPAAKKNAPVAEKKTAKKVLSTAKKAAPTYEIVPGRQATQEAFNDRLQKRLVGVGYEVTKADAARIAKVVSDTISLDILNNKASFKFGDMFFTCREIKGRITTPPKAPEDAPTTIVGSHYEAKMRMAIGDPSEYTFNGKLSKDGKTFTTKEGDSYKVESLLGNKKTVKKAVAKTEEVEEEEEIIDEDVEDEDIDFDDEDLEEFDDEE